MHSQWKERTWDVEATTQDTSNSSDGLLHISIWEATLRRLWEFKARLTLKIDKLKCKIRIRSLAES
jgi:hypothetical protein